VKKWIAILITISLLLGISAGFAEEDTEKAVEDTRQAMNELFGEARLLNLEGEGVDEPNARYIYLGYKDLGTDLCLVLRKTPTQVYFWAASLTRENFDKAKTLFTEEAPICCIQYYEGNELKINGVYSRQLASVLSYESFQEKVADAEKAIFSETSRKEIAKSDPVFSQFPGIKWGMTRDEVISTCGRGKFLLLGSSGSSTLMARPNIYLETVNVIFTFGDEDKLSMIVVSSGGENMDRYKSSYTLAYGKPHQTTLTGAVRAVYGEEIKDDSGGDCYAWKLSDTLIIVDESSVQYWALKR